MSIAGYALLGCVALMIFLFIKFPVILVGSIVLSLLFVGYLAVFGHRIPFDTDLWSGGAGG